MSVSLNSKKQEILPFANEKKNISENLFGNGNDLIQNRINQVQKWNLYQERMDIHLEMKNNFKHKPFFPKTAIICAITTIAVVAIGGLSLQNIWCMSLKF